jgi:hypothetical protein
MITGTAVVTVLGIALFTVPAWIGIAVNMAIVGVTIYYLNEYLCETEARIAKLEAKNAE